MSCDSRELSQAVTPEPRPQNTTRRVRSQRTASCGRGRRGSGGAGTARSSHLNRRGGWGTLSCSRLRRGLDRQEGT